MSNLGRSEIVHERMGFNYLEIMNSDKCRFNDLDLKDIYDDPDGCSGRSYDDRVGRFYPIELALWNQ
jgi:hypothetical protein